MKTLLQIAIFYLFLSLFTLMPSGVSSDNVKLFDPIILSFTTKGYTLSTGYSGELGEPIKAYLRLYAVKDGAAFEKIDEMEDLARLGVEIKTKDEALDFLRLFWDEKTNYLFKEKMERLLILKKGGDDEELEFVTIKEGKFKELGLEETKVSASGKKFIIELNLAKPLLSEHKVAIIRCVSSLTENGNFEMLSRNVAAIVAPIVVPIPYYE